MGNNNLLEVLKSSAMKKAVLQCNSLVEALKLLIFCLYSKGHDIRSFSDLKAVSIQYTGESFLGSDRFATDEAIEDANQQIRLALITEKLRGDSSLPLFCRAFSDFEGLLSACGRTSGEWMGFNPAVRTLILKWMAQEQNIIVPGAVLNNIPADLLKDKKSVTIETPNKELTDFYTVGQFLGDVDIEAKLIDFEKIFPTTSVSKGLVCVGPWGLRCSNTKDFQVQMMVNALATVHGRMAFVVPSNVGYSPSFEDARRQILTSQRLVSIVEFPAGACDIISRPLNVYLFDSIEEPHSTVSFTSFSGANYWSPRSSRKNALELSALGNSLIEAIANGQRLEQMTVVPVEQILGNDENCLSVNRFVVPSEDRQDVLKIESFTHTLTDFVEVIRPLPPKFDEMGDDFLEVAPADFNSAGIVELPTKNVRFNLQKVTKGFQNIILRQGDIVFCTKGLVGRCGIVLETSDNWVLGQTCVILRLKENNLGRAVALTRYLRSKGGQAYLRTIFDEGTLPVIPAKRLERMPVPVLTSMQIDSEMEKFQRQRDCLAEIERLKAEAHAEDMMEIPAGWN